MKHSVLFACFILICFYLKAQTNIDSALVELETFQHEIFNSRIYTLTHKKAANNASKTFENQGINHSTYLILNDDSTYIYYSVYEVGFDLTTGTWSQYKSDTLILNWNKNKTLDYVNDEKIYKKYFQYSTPTFVPMTNWLVKKVNNEIEPIKIVKKYNAFQIHSCITTEMQH